MTTAPVLSPPAPPLPAPSTRPAASSADLPAVLPDVQPGQGQSGTLAIPLAEFGRTLADGSVSFQVVWLSRPCFCSNASRLCSVHTIPNLSRRCKSRRPNVPQVLPQQVKRAQLMWRLPAIN